MCVCLCVCVYVCVCVGTEWHCYKSCAEKMAEEGSLRLPERNQKGVRRHGKCLAKTVERRISKVGLFHNVRCQGDPIEWGRDRGWQWAASRPGSEEHGPAASGAWVLLKRKLYLLSSGCLHSALPNKLPIPLRKFISEFADLKSLEMSVYFVSFIKLKSHYAKSYHLFHVT